jgi:serine/threonine-protein kinase
MTDVLASVLAHEPDWTLLPRGLSPTLVSYVKRCLHKDPKQRIHDMADVRLALEGAFETVGRVTNVETAYAGQAGWRRALPFAATAAAATVLTGLGAWFLWPAAAQEAVARFAHVVPDDQFFRNPGRTIMAVSPDGRAFVYNTTNGLYLRTIGELEARLIPGTEESLTNPFFSPDGEWVAYWSGGELRRIGTSGGSAVVIAGVPGNLFGAAWGNDGRILYGQPEGIFRVSASGGTPELVIPAEEGELLYGPQLLPGGDRVLFTVTTAQGAGRWDRGQIVVQSLASGDRTVLIEGGSDASYVRTGHLVYARGSDLLGVAFDVGALTTSGGSVPLVQGVQRAANPQNLTASANYGVSEQGTLVYVTGDEGLMAPLWVDASGREEPTRTPRGNYQTVSLSPDGRWAALGAVGEDGNADVWISELARGTLTRLTTDPGQETHPLWSPGGQRVAYVTDRSGSPEIVWRNADGSGSVETLLTPGAEADSLRPEGWSPDGTVLFFCLRQGRNVDFQDGSGNLDVGMVTVGEPDSWHPLLQTPAAECSPALSPDGRWLAYSSNETGGYQVYVQRFPEGTGRQQVSVTNGIRPRWSDDGRTLVYDRSNPGGAPLAVAQVAVSGGTSELGPLRFGDQTDLFIWAYYGVPGGRFQDMTPEGDRFLVLHSPNAVEGGQRNQIIIVQHWTEELERLVPTH